MLKKIISIVVIGILYHHSLCGASITINNVSKKPITVTIGSSSFTIAPNSSYHFVHQKQRLSAFTMSVSYEPLEIRVFTISEDGKPYEYNAGLSPNDSGTFVYHGPYYFLKQ